AAFAVASGATNPVAPPSRAAPGLAAAFQGTSTKPARQHGLLVSGVQVCWAAAACSASFVWAVLSRRSARRLRHTPRLANGESSEESAASFARRRGVKPLGDSAQAAAHFKALLPQ
ncbi:unnamed protein product, partial [Polarella glacialis]